MSNNDFEKLVKKVVSDYSNEHNSAPDKNIAVNRIVMKQKNFNFIFFSPIFVFLLKLIKLLQKRMSESEIRPIYLQHWQDSDSVHFLWMHSKICSILEAVQKAILLQSKS